MYDTNYDEQETIVNIDYAGSTVSIYTCRRVTFNKLKTKLGKPTRTYYIKKKVCGGTWEIPFNDRKKITSALSRPLLIGSVK